MAAGAGADGRSGGDPGGRATARRDGKATVAFPCPGCGAGRELGMSTIECASVAPTACRCGMLTTLRADALVAGAVVACPACGEAMLYQQKDFRQAVGCLVVLVAAVLAPFTWYLSLGVAALVDLVLYRLSGQVVICYRIPCKAHIRGVPAGPKVGAFDLSIHDYYRMLARREAAGLTGPDDQTGPPLDARSHP